MADFSGEWVSTLWHLANLLWLLRLVQEPARILGFYESRGPCTLEGTAEGNRRTFRYREQQTNGEGYFEQTRLTCHSGERPESSLFYLAFDDQYHFSPIPSSLWACLRSDRSATSARDTSRSTFPIRLASSIARRSPLSGISPSSLNALETLS